MACNDPELKMWFNVPRDSVFKLSVTGSDPNFAAFARFSADGNPPIQWNKPDISPGPKTAVIKAPHTYDCWVSIAFLGSAKTTVRVMAEIMDSNGQPFEQPYCREISGVMGDFDHPTLKVFGAATS